jgi:hypothetical protein
MANYMEGRVLGSVAWGNPALKEWAGRLGVLI